MKWSIQELFRINKLVHSVRDMDWKTRIKTYPKRAASRIISFYIWLTTGHHPYAALFTYDIMIYELQLRLVEYHSYIKNSPKISIADIFIDKEEEYVTADNVVKGKEKLISVLEEMIRLTTVLTVGVDESVDTYEQMFARADLMELLHKYAHYFFQ